MKSNSPTNKQKKDTEASVMTQTTRIEDELSHLMPYSPESTRFTILCRRDDYSAGRIARAIEDCNANVLNLNVTDYVSDDDRIAVDVRVDRLNTTSIARSLERYDYIVVGVEQPDKTTDEMYRTRVAELLRYIEI